MRHLDKDLTAHQRALSFKLPSNAAWNRINCLRITLQNDECDIDFEQWTWTAARQIFSQQVTGVGAENLRQTFTEYTGLHTSV